ncbi:competence protein [Meiothermus sp. QL-1]|uniref:competence protein n=1 Tax=Meiothermus sp. QL-1 TaxID=2058095 RepID=UPI000E0BFEE8|nr:competence protein [Meiothermus sp. QL-1]RDI94949.1 competence protein [Meiothermus sp. QL-1]
MYVWRYLLLGFPSGSLLAPVAVMWMVGRFEWRRALAALAFSIPFWLPAILWQGLPTTLLWLAALLALNAWAGSGALRDLRAWAFSGGIVLGHLFVAAGLVMVAARLEEVTTNSVVLPLGVGLGLLGLLLIELAAHFWRRKK